MSGTGLGTLGNWRLLSGPLASLNATWKAYGVSISVDTKTGLESHNSPLLFIDPKGNVRYRATAFADESTSGTFTLQPALEARWAEGIATYARKLMNP